MSGMRATYCVDVGSVPAGNFAWARVSDDAWEVGEGKDAATALVDRLAAESAGRT